MYTEEQVLSGVLRYCKSEVLPHLPVGTRLAAGAVLLHNASRLSELLKNGTQIMRTIDIYGSDGLIDADRWCSELKQSMNEYCGGTVDVQLPLLDKMTFTAYDIDCLLKYIRGEM